MWAVWTAQADVANGMGLDSTSRYIWYITTRIRTKYVHGSAQVDYVYSWKSRRWFLERLRLFVFQFPRKTPACTVRTIGTTEGANCSWRLQWLENASPGIAWKVVQGISKGVPGRNVVDKELRSFLTGNVQYTFSIRRTHESCVLLVITATIYLSMVPMHNHCYYLSMIPMYHAAWHMNR